MPGKLGIGLYQPDQGLADEVINSGASTCLIFNTALSWASYVKERNSGITIIGRKYFDPGEQAHFLNLPSDQQYAECHAWGVKLVQDFPAVDVWQFINEVYARPDFGVLIQQREAEWAFTLGVVSQGRTSCVLNIPPGNESLPWESDWTTFRDIIRPLLETPGVRFWGVHSYGSPEHPQLAAPDADYNALRYRAFVNGLQADGVRVPELVITEYGQRWGWRYQGFMNEEQCIADFRWLGERMDEDGIVFGSTNFLHGTENEAMWRDFNTAYTGIWGQLSCWNKRQDPCDAPPPPPPPPPPGGSLGVAIFALVAAGVFAGAYYLTKD